MDSDTILRFLTRLVNGTDSDTSGLVNALTSLIKDNSTDSEGTRNYLTNIFTNNVTEEDSDLAVEFRNRSVRSIVPRALNYYDHGTGTFTLLFGNDYRPGMFVGTHSFFNFAWQRAGGGGGSRWDTQHPIEFIEERERDSTVTLRLDPRDHQQLQLRRIGARIEDARLNIFAGGLKFAGSAYQDRDTGFMTALNHDSDFVQPIVTGARYIPGFALQLEFDSTINGNSIKRDGFAIARSPEPPTDSDSDVGYWIYRPESQGLFAGQAANTTMFNIADFNFDSDLFAEWLRVDSELDNRNYIGDHVWIIFDSDFAEDRDGNAIQTGFDEATGRNRNVLPLPVTINGLPAIEHFVGGVDSDWLLRTIDSDYINARVDSEHIRLMIDSEYINARVDSEHICAIIDRKVKVDSDFVINTVNDLAIDSDELRILVDSDYLLDRNVAFFKAQDSGQPVAGGYPVGTMVYVINDDRVGVKSTGALASTTVSEFTPLLSLQGGDSEQFQFVNARDNAAIASARRELRISEADSDWILRNIDSDHVQARAYDSDAFTTRLTSRGVATSSGINILNQRVDADSDRLTAVIETILDSDHVADIVTENLPRIIDSEEVIALIDSDHVQERQVDETGFDSDQIVTIINENTVTAGIDSETVLALIDSDYVQERQSNDGTGFDSDQVVSIINENTVAGGVDSETVLALIDSDHVQARQSNDGTGFDSDQVVSIIEENRVPAGVDSETVLALIDSDYVQERQATVGSGFDSDQVVTIINENRIENQVDSEWVLGNTVDSDFLMQKLAELDSDEIVALIRQRIADINSDSEWVLMTIDELTVDSDEVLNLINQSRANIDSDFVDTRINAVVDSDYVQERQSVDDTGFDSDQVVTIIRENTQSTNPDSEWVESRIIAAQNNKVDSDWVLSTIDSDYIQARQVDLTGFDSDQINTIIDDRVDNTYVQARQSNGFDSDQIIVIIEENVDSTYVQARQSNVGGGFDSDQIVAIIGENPQEVVATLSNEDSDRILTVESLLGVGRSVAATPAVDTGDSDIITYAQDGAVLDDDLVFRFKIMDGTTQVHSTLVRVSEGTRATNLLRILSVVVSQDQIASEFFARFALSGPTNNRIEYAFAADRGRSLSVEIEITTRSNNAVFTVSS